MITNIPELLRESPFSDSRITKLAGLISGDVACSSLICPAISEYHTWQPCTHSQVKRCCLPHRPAGQKAVILDKKCKQ